MLAIILLYQIISIEDPSSDSYTLLVLLFWFAGAIVTLGIDVVSAAQVNYHVTKYLHTKYTESFHLRVYFSDKAI